MEAKLNCSNTVKLELVLTDKEFHWLKDMLQNPMYEDESPTERMMRGKWWHALNSAWQNFIPF